MHFSGWQDVVHAWRSSASMHACMIVMFWVIANKSARMLYHILGCVVLINILLKCGILSVQAGPSANMRACLNIIVPAGAQFNNPNGLFPM